MAGNKIGGAKCAATNKAKYGENFYRVIGSLGGSTITDKPKGFAVNRELARTAGRRGGQISRRKPLYK